MATGGIFQLITNDGKQDRMLMATQLLNKRIAAARVARRKLGGDGTPTLYDIEKTHIIFTNAHFKPFAAIGYEYNKVQGNGASLGSSITFSIPQFGDFFHDMIVHIVLNQPLFKDQSGTPVSDQSLMRWCDYPGERILKKVSFQVNGNPLDEYEHEATNFHRQFQVQPNKETGWKRCVGQQDDEQGWIQQPNWADSGVASADVRHRMKACATSGNQTPTGQKTEKLEMFIPLLFWCNRDPRLSVPSVAIPYGQRFITVDLATQVELVGEVPRGANSYDSLPDANTLVIDNDRMVDKMDLYINNIFVNPEVHNIFIKRIGFTLIRVHRQQKSQCNQESTECLLQQLKWPIETLFVGMRLREYENTERSVARRHLDRWHKFSKVDDVERACQGWKAARQTCVADGKWLEVFDGKFDNVLAENAGYFRKILEATTPPTGWSSVDLDNAASDLDARECFQVGDTIILTLVDVNGVKSEYTLNVTGIQHNISGEDRLLLSTPHDVQIAGDIFDLIYAHPGPSDAEKFAQAAYNIKVIRCVDGEKTAVVQKCTRTLDRVTIKAHGIPIYNDFPSQFFNAYIPYHYGGPNIRTPEDCGALMITFCLYPGTYQPSGHINVSRAREFYIHYTSSVIGQQNDTGTLVVLASAINFLLISDGSAVLRYST